MRVARFWLVAVVLAGAGAACGDFADDAPSGPSDDGGADATPAATKDAAPTVDGNASVGADARADGDASGPRPFRYVFVSKSTHEPKFGDVDAGLAGADAFCANEALGTPLANLHWRAWLGTFLGAQAVNPRDRIADASVVPYEYQLVTGEVVFKAGFHFVEGTLLPDHVIDRDQLGAPVLEEEVWTGAGPDGKAASVGRCIEWTWNGGNNETGVTGFTTRGDAGPTHAWTSALEFESVHRDCNTITLHRLYCFEVDP